MLVETFSEEVKTNNVVSIVYSLRFVFLAFDVSPLCIVLVENGKKFEKKPPTHVRKLYHSCGRYRIVVVFASFKKNLL